MTRSVPPAHPEGYQTSERDEVLIDTLIAMVRRAQSEMPSRTLRDAFETDLKALLKEHGRDIAPVKRSSQG